MDAHPSIAYLEGEADALDLEAARIEAALRQDDCEAAARESIEQAEGRLQAMSRMEARTIGAVLREHVGDAAATPLGWEMRALHEAAQVRRRIQRHLAAGNDCRSDLEAYARHLHAAAAIEREQVAPWARHVLGENLLREADARLADYGVEEPDVGIDWDLGWPSAGSA